MSNSRLFLQGLSLAFTLGLAIYAAEASAETSAPNTTDAVNAPATTMQTPPPVAQGFTNDVKNTTQYCPKQTELSKKDMFWYGPDSWRDYSASFVKTIGNFAGAQWVGINVGKIICLYKGSQGNDFPVALERDDLMQKPRGDHWQPDPNSGYQICKSDNILDCPFLPQEVKSNTNIYDFLKDMKK